MAVVNTNGEDTTNNIKSGTGRTTAGNDKIKIPLEDERKLEARGYRLGEAINSGSFARVYRATRRIDDYDRVTSAPITTELRCAAKVIDLSSTSDDYRLKFLPRELYTMKKLRHPHVIPVYDIFSIAAKRMIVIFMDLAEGGDLLDVIRAEGALPEPRARTLYAQFGDALRYMHSLNFAHRDVKCENVLLDRTRTYARLTDFGFARTCYDACTGRRLLSATYCGSAAYVAPEVLRAHPYCPLKSDVWSSGIVLFVLLNNRLPFADTDNRKLSRRQIERKYNFSRQLSPEAKDVIAQLLNPSPAQRPRMVEILAEAWFAMPNTTIPVQLNSTAPQQPPQPPLFPPHIAATRRNN